MLINKNGIRTNQNPDMDFKDAVNERLDRLIAMTEKSARLYLNYIKQEKNEIWLAYQYFENERLKPLINSNNNIIVAFENIGCKEEIIAILKDRNVYYHIPE